MLGYKIILLVCSLSWVQVQSDDGSGSGDSMSLNFLMPIETQLSMSSVALSQEFSPATRHIPEMDSTVTSSPALTPILTPTPSPTSRRIAPTPTLLDPLHSTSSTESEPSLVTSIRQVMPTTSSLVELEPTSLTVTPTPAAPPTPSSSTPAAPPTPSSSTPALTSSSHTPSLTPSSLPTSVLIPSFPSSPTPIPSTTSSLPTSVVTPSSTLLMSTPPSLPPSTTISVGLIAGVAIGGVVITFIVLIVILVCCVACRKRRKGFVLGTAGSEHFHLYQATESKQEQVDFISSQKREDEIINFGITSDTFGIATPSATSPSTFQFPETDIQEGAEQLPKLVFFNAVDPSIPIVSNKKDYSRTLPTMQKIQRTGVSQSTFEPPPEKLSNSSEDILVGSTFKAGVSSRSTGAINKVAVTQPLRENLQLQDLAKQKANSSCLQSPLYDSPKASITPASPQPNDGYVFMEPKTSSTKQLSDSSGPAVKTPHVALSKQSGDTAEGLYDVPKALKPKKVSVTSLKDKPSVDTSHYDVPRRLLQERAAAMKQDSTTQLPVVAEDLVQNQSAQPHSKKPAGPPPKPTRKTSLDNMVLSSRNSSASSLGTKEASRNPDISPSNGVKVLPSLDFAVSKPEGIYDVPRSILKQKSNTTVELKAFEKQSRSSVSLSLDAPMKKPRSVSPSMDAPTRSSISPSIDVPKEKPRSVSPSTITPKEKPRPSPKPSSLQKPHSGEDKSLAVTVKPTPKARTRKLPVDH